jgi:hypothetical protein
MRKPLYIIISLSATCAFLFPAIRSSAQSEGFGIGLIIGEPTGISGKYWTGEKTAFDGGVAWSFVDQGALHVHADYLVHLYDVIPVANGALPLYFGGGGRINVGQDFVLGARGVVGLNYHFSGAPVDVFIEIAPVFDFLPSTRLSMNGGIGVRYFLEAE